MFIVLIYGISWLCALVVCAVCVRWCLCAGALHPMTFFKAHGKLFPGVAQVARLYLAMQLTSVSVESFFSYAGAVLSLLRTSMGVHMFRYLCLLKANSPPPSSSPPPL